MSEKIDYSIKLTKFLASIPLTHLGPSEKDFIINKARDYRLTFQELRKFVETFTDLIMWKEAQNIYPLEASSKRDFLDSIENYWKKLKDEPKSYHNFQVPRPNKIKNITFKTTSSEKNRTILGKCPVASEKTLCCNLQTLDAINNCGFECSYCSIQSFFPHNTVTYEESLKNKLEQLNIEPNKIYHIGTGQSSDSLLWGNKGGILDSLVSFAQRNPNVILELKTKSKNIAYFLQNTIPKNIIVTWSINTNTIIENEEHNTANLEERLRSARALADKGILVGFHFHPIIYYHNYEKEYEEVIQRILKNFTHEQIALVSLGTLTFTKPVIKEIRKKKIFSKILQMPLEEASGKMSYPQSIKIEMFKNIYQKFSAWHKDVFFYLCMENKELWPIVFNKSYSSNEEFENEMKKSYMKKINSF